MPRSVSPPDGVLVIVPDDQFRFFHPVEGSELFEPKEGCGFAMDDDDYAAAAIACAHIQAHYPNKGEEGFDFGIDVDDPLLDEIELEADDKEADEEYWKSVVKIVDEKKPAGRYVRRKGPRNEE